jgi:hypothetical protein
MMYSLMTAILVSKHVKVIKKIQCFSVLPVAFTVARAGVCINIFIYQCTDMNHVNIRESRITEESNWIKNA